MKRGFTLIELMVVISVIAVLSSVVLSATSAAKAKARDSQRTQEAHQINLAVQLYTEDNHHAPFLGAEGNSTLCAAQQAGNVVWDSNSISACIAVSTAAVDSDSWTAWQQLKNELVPKYMPSIPDDPCGTSCTTSTGGTAGYTYTSPAALQLHCGGNCSQSVSQLNQSYQLNPVLENPLTLPLPTITFTFYYSSSSEGGFPRLDWSSADATSCTSSTWPGTATSGQWTDYSETPSLPYTIACTGPGGTASQTALETSI